MTSRMNEVPMEVLQRKADSKEDYPNVDSKECPYCMETLYCTGCMRVVCAECFLRSHDRHRTLDVDKAAEDFRKELAEAEQELPECLSAYRDKRIRLEHEMSRFLKQIEKLEKEVKRRGREMKKLVDEHVASLVSQLDAFKQVALKDVEEEKEEMERHIGILEHYGQSFVEISATGLASRDICRRMSKVSVRSDELRQLRRSILCNPVSSPGVAFEKRELSEFLEINGNANIVGKIVFHGGGTNSEFIRMVTDNTKGK